MEKPLVSIIVPIYKVQDYIEKCIVSLINQNYENIEILLIDDGSPDKSGCICDKYAIKDNRVCVIHRNNRGVSSARNEGLEMARGEFITFVDGDDYVENSHITYLFELIKKNDCILATGSYFSLPTNNVNHSTVSIYNNEQIIEMIYLCKTGVPVWNKIYNTKYILEKDLKFNENYWFAEGMLFNIEYLQKAGLVAVGSANTYHATENMKSATRDFKLANYICGVKSMECQKSKWTITTKNIQMAWEYHYREYAHSILKGLYKTNQIELNKTIYNKCIKILKNNISIPLGVDIENHIKDYQLSLKIDPEIVISKQMKFKDCKSIIKKIRLLKIKFVYHCPTILKKHLYKKIMQYYKSHYKPIYLNKSLFE